MGGVKVGDKIIVADTLGHRVTILGKRVDIEGKLAEVVVVDPSGCKWPYKVIYDGQYFWVEGYPYSPLLEELF